MKRFVVRIEGVPLHFACSPAMSVILYFDKLLPMHFKRSHFFYQNAIMYCGMQQKAAKCRAFRYPLGFPQFLRYVVVCPAVGNTGLDM